MRPDEAERIGEVQLALGVVGPERGERCAQGSRAESIEAGVHLPDRALLRRTVVLFDDAFELTLGIAHHPAVAGGVVEIDREERAVGLR